MMILGRLGGEEFGIIIKGNSQKLLLSIAERIRKTLKSNARKNYYHMGLSK